jgi:hypothetical protein
VGEWLSTTLDIILFDFILQYTDISIISHTLEYRSNYVEKTFLHEVSESDEEEYEIVAKKASL